MAVLFLFLTGTHPVPHRAAILPSSVASGDSFPYEGKVSRVA